MKMKNIKIEEKLRIESSGKHFYRIGLTYYNNGCEDRIRIYNPIFIFILINSFIIKNIITITNRGKSDHFYLYRYTNTKKGHF